VVALGRGSEALSRGAHGLGPLVVVVLPHVPLDLRHRIEMAQRVGPIALPMPALQAPPLVAKPQRMERAK